MYSYASQYNFSKTVKYIVFIGIIVLMLIGSQFIPYLPLSKSVYVNSSYLFKSFINEQPTSRVLIVYVYGKTHAMSEGNLAFFIRNAVRDTHNADYYFILQKIKNQSFNETLLPKLPSNAHYIQHENKCFDIGTIGWFLSCGIIDKNKYKYFIFLNSSVRGPFIVTYYDSSIWHTIFTRRLNNYTKLVGPTINCETAPHVQSYFWALDLQGLDLLLNSTTIFACHGSKTAAINNAEIRASQLLIRSGYGIDSLMKKYQGINFREEKHAKCKSIGNPTFTRTVDGISLDPFEVVFIKIKDRMAEFRDNRERVAAYEKWIS